MKVGFGFLCLQKLLKIDEWVNFAQQWVTVEAAIQYQGILASLTSEK